MTPIVISGKRSSAVLLSAEDWSAIQETLDLLAVPGVTHQGRMAEPSWRKRPRSLTGDLGRCFCEHALEDAKKLAASGLKPKAKSGRRARQQSL